MTMGPPPRSCATGPPRAAVGSRSLSAPPAHPRLRPIARRAPARTRGPAGASPRHLAAADLAARSPQPPPRGRGDTLLQDLRRLGPVESHQPEAVDLLLVEAGHHGRFLGFPLLSPRPGHGTRNGQEETHVRLDRRTDEHGARKPDVESPPLLVVEVELDGR